MMKLVMKKKHNNFILGTLRTNPKGFGFVIPQNSELEDIFIPKDSIGSAMDGDIVKVELSPIYSSKGPSGHIHSIVKRGKITICGIVKDKRKNIFNATLVDKNILLTGSHEDIKIGDILKLKISEIRKKVIFTTLLERIGNIYDPSIDIKFATEEFNLRMIFPDEVIQEAKNFGSEITENDLKNRKDFTKLECITIDPDTAKDYDDAISLNREKNGHFKLGVHIADVAHYVKPNSCLDIEAKKRGNSTYFQNYVIPMLPQTLSNELCSLKPNVIRLTVSVIMHFNENGKLLRYEIFRSYIKSRHRFTYKEAYKILQSKETVPFKDLLRNMKKLFLLLHKNRQQRGSIDFSMPEEIIHVDADGNPLNIEIAPYDISHQIIEEFMLKANELIAVELSDSKKGSIYRVHEEPSCANFNEFYTFARSLGFKLPMHPKTTDLAKLFLEVKHTEYAKHFSLHFIKSLKLATYSSTNIGHFGLALKYYCHFTSPIRRYTDLIAQRLLFNEEKDIDLEEIAKHSSIQERASAQAENLVSNLKKLRFLLAHHEKHPKYLYHGVITRIKPFLIYFEIDHFFIEGSCHIATLDNDYYVFNEKNMHLIGCDHGKIYKFGDKIKVRIINASLITSSIEWQIVEL